MNRKLELQILNSEIRAALPGLEKAAARSEINVHMKEKAAKSCGIEFDKIPSLFVKSSAELEIDIERGIKEKARLKEILNNDVENLRKEKRMLTNEIGKECSFEYLFITLEDAIYNLTLIIFYSNFLFLFLFLFY